MSSACWRGSPSSRRGCSSSSTCSCSARVWRWSARKFGWSATNWRWSAKRLASSARASSTRVDARARARARAKRSGAESHRRAQSARSATAQSLDECLCYSKRCMARLAEEDARDFGFAQRDIVLCRARIRRELLGYNPH